MEAKEKSFSFMESEGLVEIPFFQRPYVWEEDQWKQLYSDLVDSFKDEKKEHFLGSIVLKQLHSNAGDGTYRILIDGQQRLTTFSIMVKALYDLLEQDEKSDYAKYLFRKPTKDKNPKIQHCKVNRLSFEQILRSDGIASLLQQGFNEEDRLMRCYKFFSEKISEDLCSSDLSNSKEFLDYVCETNLWVTINLGEKEDEQKIFDSLNTAGLKLTATDIIKNAIFARAICLKLDYERLYADYWEGIFEGNLEFWEEVVATGRLQRTKSEIFLHAFSILDGFFDPNQDTLENLSIIYKKHISKLKASDFEDFCARLRSYANKYRKFPAITNETSFMYESYEERFFQLLRVAEVSTVLPLVLLLKMRFEKDEQKYKECLYLLECLILYRWITEKTTKQYNKFFARCIKSMQDEFSVENLKKLIIDTKDFFPEQDDVKNWLNANGNDDGYILGNKRARFVLFWIELYRRSLAKNKQDLIELQDKYTLEHLMPQNPEEENWGEITQCEDIDELTYQIGNLTLLKGSLNSSISNNSWKIKLNGDDRKRNCIKKCADLLITKEVLELEDWNRKTIEERSKSLIRDFFIIWNLN